MADNSVMGSGDTIRDKDRSGVKTQIFGIDVGIAGGTEALLSVTNPMPVVQVAAPATSTLTGVTASATSGTVLASNANRRGATVYNAATSAILYLRLGATAATAASGGYSVALAAGAYYEVPFGYTGQLTGIWATATGYANVTEVTA